MNFNYQLFSWLVTMKIAGFVLWAFYINFYRLCACRLSFSVPSGLPLERCCQLCQNCWLHLSISQWKTCQGMSVSNNGMVFVPLWCCAAYVGSWLSTFWGNILAPSATVRSSWIPLALCSIAPFAQFTVTLKHSEFCLRMYLCSYASPNSDYFPKQH